MDLLDYSLLALIGVGAGFINVLAGGGSLLTVPALLFMDVPGPVANGTNRIAIIAQSFTAVIAFFKRGYHNLKLSVTLAASLLPGAIIGAYLGTEIAGVVFNRLLAIVMLAVMLSSLLESKTPAASQRKSASTTPRRVVLTHLLIAVIGFYGGLIHIGIGFFIMPVLHRVAALDLIEVNAHKMAIILPYSVVALVIFARESGVMWVAGLALAIGNSVGGWLGVHFAVKQGERLIKIIFNLALLALIIKLLISN
ncbi:MAG: sulfite exporter TauE/SafE family protein [Pseudomonadota bacterium]